MDVEQDAAAAGADVDMDPAAAPEGTIACWLGFGEPGQEGVAKQEGDENPAKAEQSLHELERLSAMRLGVYTLSSTSAAIHSRLTL